jgi:hypothetical protein
MRAMKRLLAVLTALALPAGAIAKEPVKAQVCGAGGCVTSQDKQAIFPLVQGGPPAPGPPAHGAPGYRVRITIGGEPGMHDTYAEWIVPSLGLIRGSQGDWMTLPAATLAALRKVAPGVRPFPAGRVPLTGHPQTTGGALPPQTYKVADTPKATPAAESAGGDGGTPWWLIGGIVAALAALGAGAARLRTAHS